MRNFLVGTVLSFVVLLCSETSASETISFKGITFGMSADAIAKLAGGNTKYGCASAIQQNDILNKSKTPWTYGGIDSWSASCMEGYSKEKIVPGVSGLIRIHSLVHSHENSLGKMAGYKTYNVDELAEIFSTVFGEFRFNKAEMKDGLGRSFTKQTAIARSKGAQITIYDNISGQNHEGFINIDIESVDYLQKKAASEVIREKLKIDAGKKDF